MRIIHVEAAAAFSLAELCQAISRARCKLLSTNCLIILARHALYLIELSHSLG